MKTRRDSTDFDMRYEKSLGRKLGRLKVVWGVKKLSERQVSGGMIFLYSILSSFGLILAISR